MGRRGVPNKTNKWETHIQPRLSEISQWLVDGEQVLDICKKLEIHHDTWYRYLKENEVFSELVDMSRTAVNNKVERSLLRLCMGFEYEEIKTIVEEDKSGKKRTRVEKTKKYQPPSSNALSFWLRNRAPDQWNDKRELILDTKDNEEARKKLFLEMIEAEIIEVECEEDQAQLVDSEERYESE